MDFRLIYIIAKMDFFFWFCGESLENKQQLTFRVVGYNKSRVSRHG